MFNVDLVFRDDLKKSVNRLSVGSVRVLTAAVSHKGEVAVGGVGERGRSGHRYVVVIRIIISTTL